MKSKITITAFTFLALLVSSSWADMVDTGLIDNGDFAVSPLDNGWTLSDSRVRYVWLSPEDSVSGRGRVTLKSYDDNGTTVQAVLSQQIDNLQTNTDYIFQADHDYWGTEVRSGVPQSWLRVSDVSGNLINDYERSGGNGWQTLEVSFNTEERTSVVLSLVGTHRPWEAESYFENAVLLPEPTTLGLIAVGCGLGLLRKRKTMRE